MHRNRHLPNPCARQGLSLPSLRLGELLGRLGRSCFPGIGLARPLPFTGLSYYSDLDCVGSWVVDSQVVGEFADYRACIFWTVCLDVHPEELACTDAGHLLVATLQNEILMNRLSFRISSEGLVLNDDFDYVAAGSHTSLY